MGRKPSPDSRSETIKVRVTPDQRQALQAAARSDGATESEFIRRLIADELRRRQGKGGRRA